MTGVTDQDSGGWLVIPQTEERIHAGRLFIASYKNADGSQLADDDTLDIFVRVGANPVHFVFSASASNNIEIAFYENPTTTNNGTSLNAVGMNRHRSLSSQVTIFRDPTVSAVGDLLFNVFARFGVQEVEQRQGSHWILKENTNYIVRHINRAGSAIDISCWVQWHEANV